MKLLGSELCISNTLTCDLLVWFCRCAMILVITPSVWRTVCVTTPSVWRPVYVTTHLWCPIFVMTHDNLSVWRPGLYDDFICVTNDFVYVTTHLCDNPICMTTSSMWRSVYVTTLSVWRPRLCDDLSMWRPPLCDDLFVWRPRLYDDLVLRP